MDALTQGIVLGVLESSTPKVNDFMKKTLGTDFVLVIIRTRGYHRGAELSR